MSEESVTDTASPDAAAWAAWVAHLADEVGRLVDRGSLTVAGPPGSERPIRLRRARLGGFIPARHEVVSPWVRLVRLEDFLRGYCVGAELIGAHFPMSPDEDAALVALGWHHPTPTDGEDYLRFWPDDVPQGPFLPREEAERAATMVAATFRDVLAVDATDLPTVATGSGSGANPAGR